MKLGRDSLIFGVVSLALVCLVGVSDVFGQKAINIDDALEKLNVVHMAIVGSGPAGLSAALYGARFKRDTLVFEGNKPGGLLTETSTVENWPGSTSILGRDLMDNIKKHAQELGVQFVSDSVEKVDLTQWPFVLHTENGEEINALSVIIATGARPRKLGIAGEEEYWGAGVTTCAVCDAPFYKNENVVVIGGGDSAIESSVQLAQYAKNVTILVRKERMRAAPTMQQRLKEYPNISIRYNVEVKAIKGDNIRVTGVELWDNKERVTENMPIDGVFLSIGHEPNTQLFNSDVKIDSHGYIHLDGRSQKTSIKGIFAAGDAEDAVYRQAIVAAGSGVRAAIDSDAFLTSIGLSPGMAKRLQPQLFTYRRRNRTVDGGFAVRSLKEFDGFVTNNDLVVVDFYKKDCPMSNQMHPVFDAIAEEFATQATFVKVDADEATDVVEKFFIHKVPCLLVFNKGSLSARYGDMLSKDELRTFVQQFLG